MRFIFGLVCLVLSCGVAAAECRSDQIALKGDWGSVRFNIEIADTIEERATGLMHRASMPRNAGMLFVYEAPQRVAFWMKNTLIPLDMIFVGPSGVVTRVHHRARPGDLTAIDGGTGVLAVLEINGGLARDYGIEPGTLVQHAVFSGRSPAWPC